MLATIPSQHPGGSSRFSTEVAAHDTFDYAEAEVTMEDRLCPGCRKSVVNENGGLVVAFGQSFFHVDCFKCAKCGDQVTADTNLLLLSDGSPICANCSYSCNVCNLPILDEAIMTGDDSYHAHCFKCKVCKTRIDELVFAKTSQGIYCMNCHNERMAKIRRHAQKKKEKEKAGGLAKSRERANGTGGAGEFGILSPRTDGSYSVDSSMRSTNPSRNDHKHQPSHVPLVSDAFKPNTKLPTTTAISITPETPPKTPKHHKQLSVTVAPPADRGEYTLSSTPSPLYTRFQEQAVAPITTKEPSNQSSTMGEYLAPSNNHGGSTLQRKKSYDDGIRPLNVLFRKDSKSGPSEGLNVPGNSGTTPRNEKRHSFQVVRKVSTDSSPIHSSPRSASFPQPQSSLSPLEISESQSPTRSPTRSPTGDRIPTRSTSPQPLSPRINSLRNSTSTCFVSATSTPLPVDNDHRQDQSADRTTPKARSPNSSSTYLPEHQQPGDLKSPVKPSLTLEQVPSRFESLSALDRQRLSVDTSGFGQGRSSPTPGSPSARLQKSFDGRRSPSGGEHRLSSNSNPPSSRPVSGSRSRPTSDLRRADVPHSVESGTDTEGEREDPESRSDESGDATSSLPPNEPGDGQPKDLHIEIGNGSDADYSPETSKNTPLENDDLEESEMPVESTSVATFIAPALPPIRFSMTGADFSDMLKNVGGVPSLKALDQLAKLSEEADCTPATPPPTAAMPLTPGNDVPPHSNVQSYSGVRHKVLRKPPPSVSLNGRPSIDDLTRAPPSAFDRSGSGSQFKRSFSTENERSRNQPSNPSLNSPLPTDSNSNATLVTITPPDSNTSRPIASDSTDLVVRRLQEAYADATERGAQQLKLDKGFVEAILTAFEQRRKSLEQLKVKYDGVKRASQQYVDGLTVASTEYDQELKARRDAEAEVTRLRVLLSGQAVRLTTISGEAKKQELRQQMSKELSDNLIKLERDLSKLRVDRDMALAEVEELSASKNSPTRTNGEIPAVKLSRSLTMRLDNIKTQYQHELVPLTQQRNALAREISDLKAARDMFLEETTVLNARNEELAQLSAQYARRMDTSNVSDDHSLDRHEAHPPSFERKSRSFDKNRPPYPGPMQHSVSASTTSSATAADDTNGTFGRSPKHPHDMASPMARPGKFKWPGSKARDPSSVTMADNKGPRRREHTFQQLSVLRFTRCDHCGDKMWGSQLRCSGCNMSVHVRCFNHVQVACAHHPPSNREPQVNLTPLPPSMFGRDLAEQIRTDAKGGDRQVPIIVEKCIDAVEALALDYEGIYRKNGGSGQSKAITQLFEHGDYNAFDLRDQERFNDICSVTSVLKTYFRSLPVPLLTYDLHDEFITAASIKDPDAKYEALLETVNKLPNEYYYTLRLLMLHLHNVRQQSDVNLMTARNLGVVFGPTLMRSWDPSTEFDDMAGKAIAVEWLVDNAPAVFAAPLASN